MSMEQEEITTPILSVDESLTTEERLTDNAVNNILPARYLVGDEDPDDMFWRVADNVATAEYLHSDDDENFEEWREEFYELMSTLRFTPNSPTLMNAGDTLQQLSACFVIEVGDSMAERDEFGRDSILDSAKNAGQIFKCLTKDSRVYIEEDGYIPISSVETGDQIIQHSGSGEVSEVHEYADADVMTVTLENGVELTGTPNHKLFTNGEEKRIDKLNEGETIDLSLNWIADNTTPVELETVPETLWETNEKPELHNAIIRGVEDGESDYEIAESVPESPSTVQRHRKDILGIDAVNNSGRKYQGGYTNNKESGFNSVAQPEVLTRELAWMVGMWIGDGSYHEDGIRFHSAEENIVNKISETSERLFDLTVSTSHDGSCYEVGLYSSAIKRYWQENFGNGKPDGAHSASVPECIYQSDRDTVISFIRGLYDADGTIMRNRYPSLTTVSHELSKGVQQLLHGIGIPATIWTGKNCYQVRPTNDGIDRFLDVVGANQSYELDDLCGDTSPVTTHSSTVSSITDSGTNTVYDITVNGKHEYVASSIRSHNSGGGVGYTFGFLRPKGTHIESTDSKTSGPMEFMRLFDTVCHTVKQGGKRRGAQMAIMPVDHPDIARFVTAKRTEGDYSNFNISVGLTDEFIEAVQEDELYELNDPRDNFEETFEIVQATKNLLSPSASEKPEAVVDENIWRDYADDMDAWNWDANAPTSFRNKWKAHFRAAEEEGNLDVGEPLALPARFIWDMIIDGAWRNGEPGLFYMDETNREHSFDVDEYPEYEIHATNPCAEQPLCNYEACNLGHINLSLMVQEGVTDFDSWKSRQDFDYSRSESAVVDFLNESVDYEELDRVIESGVRFLDNVVDMSDFPLDSIENTVSNMRKIGLGVMGWAQMLYQLGIPYGSDESYAAAEHVMSYIDAKATRASHELALERGSFGAWEDSKYSNPTEYEEWFENHTYVSPEDHEDGYEMRNHNVTTVAPTGTTSMIADTSGGIEPVYNVAYKKNVGNDIQGAEKLVEFDSYFVEALEAHGLDVENMKRMAATQMDENRFEGVQSLPIPQKLKDIFVTTEDLSSRQHGLMQRSFQEAVDSGISKTINLPNDANHADVHEAYMLALRDDEIGAPIKGLTVYRDGSRKEQVLSSNEQTKASLDEAQEKLEQAGYDVIEPDEGGEN